MAAHKVSQAGSKCLKMSNSSKWTVEKMKRLKHSCDMFGFLLHVEQVFGLGTESLRIPIDLNLFIMCACDTMSNSVSDQSQSQSVPFNDNEKPLNEVSGKDSILIR